jgi:riboflavin kinase/FMN adenylyltransferase
VPETDVSIYESLEQAGRSTGGRCIAVGTFDGVHIGHAALIGRLVERSRAEGLEATVVTFRNHPAEVVAPQRAPRLLTPWPMKRRLIGDLGVGTIIGIEFDRRLASIPAEGFVQVQLVDHLQMKCMIAGPTFGFGSARAGDRRLLERLSGEMGFGLEIVEKRDLGGRSVSSSAIRRSIESGDVEAAAPLLGRDFSLAGKVARGTGRGREIGFPTANLDCDPRQLLPGDGVYAAWALVEGARFASAVSVGPQPTFDAPDRLVEAYLVGFEGDLYGKGLEIAFKRRLRPIEKFETQDRLTRQIQADVDLVRKVLREADEPESGSAVGSGTQHRLNGR